MLPHFLDGQDESMSTVGEEEQLESKFFIERRKSKCRRARTSVQFFVDRCQTKPDVVCECDIRHATVFCG